MATRSDAFERCLGKLCDAYILDAQGNLLKASLKGQAKAAIDWPGPSKADVDAELALLVAEEHEQQIQAKIQEISASRDAAQYQADRVTAETEIG